MDEKTKIVKTRPTVDELMNQIRWPFNRFFLFLTIAVVFAVIMGAVSYGIYRMSDGASLDLSLPSHQKQLREKNNSAPTRNSAIEPSGVVDEVFTTQVIDYVERYQKSVGEAKPFAPEVLLDENLINLTTSSAIE